jgi:hypothetical protein
MRILSVSSDRLSIQQEWGVQLGADGSAQRLDVFHEGFRPQRSSRNEVRMTADVFGEGIKRKIRTVFDQPLKNGAEQRVIAREDRRMSLSLADRVRDAADHRYVDQAVGGVRRGFDENHRYPAFADSLFRRQADRRFVDTIGEANRVDGKAGKGLGEQGFGASIERLGVQDHVAWTDESEDRGRNRGHAGGEQRAFIRTLVDREPVLDDFAVGMIEPRINQTCAHSFGRLAPARNVIEVVLSVLGGPEHEGRGQEDRWLDGALRQLRIVAVVQHQRFGMQHVVADMGL